MLVGMPKTPTALGNELRRLAPLLREHAVSIEFKRNHHSRVITIRGERMKAEHLPLFRVPALPVAGRDGGATVFRIFRRRGATISSR
jgi:hypothetical protein